MHQTTATTPLDIDIDVDNAGITVLAAEVSSAAARAVADAAGDYAVELVRGLVRILGTRRSNDADDIAAEAAAKFLGLPATRQHAIMTECPAAFDHARRIAKRSAYDFDRQERVQACFGARLYDDGEGGRRAGRIWHSGDAPIARGEYGGASLFDVCTNQAPIDIADEVVERVVTEQQLELVLTGLGPDEREIILRVDGHGEEVRQLADEAGCARETMSRRTSKIRRTAANNADRVKTGEMPTSTAHPAPTRNDIP